MPIWETWTIPLIIDRHILHESCPKFTNPWPKKKGACSRSHGDVTWASMQKIKAPVTLKMNETINHSMNWRVLNFHWHISPTTFNSRDDHHSWGLKGFRTDCVISQVQIQFCCGNKLCSSAGFGVNDKTILKSLLVHSTMAYIAPVHRAETQKRQTRQRYWKFICVCVCQTTLLRSLGQIGSKGAPLYVKFGQFCMHVY